MTTDYPTPTVSTDWLADHLNDPTVVVLDSSFYLPAMNLDPKAEFRQKRIPGARYFDFDKTICDQNASLAHMLPNADYFAQEVGKLGVSNDSFVVAYDGAGWFSAARCWWMFRVFGHDRVAVLDGGMPKWTKEGKPMEETPPSETGLVEYSATFRPHLVKSADEVLKATETATIFDARSAGRYHGTEPEPRAGLRSGHIPGSQSMPFTSLLSEDGTLRSAAELQAIFDQTKFNPDADTICSCGSGVTACNVALALHVLGHDKVAVYDGSWSEWGQREDLPIEV